jgi:hypothetical protein
MYRTFIQRPKPSRSRAVHINGFGLYSKPEPCQAEPKPGFLGQAVPEQPYLALTLAFSFLPLLRSLPEEERIPFGFMHVVQYLLLRLHRHEGECCCLDAVTPPRDGDFWYTSILSLLP